VSLLGVWSLCWLRGTSPLHGNYLKAKDGAVVYGRTMEWGSFDLNSQVVIYPRGYSSRPYADKKPVWRAGPYGFVDSTV